MSVMPTVDQFPSFTDTHSWLAKTKYRCIWYLPDKKRCCFVGIKKENSEAALRLIETIVQLSLSPKEELQALADIAAQCCCGRHHRNRICGSGLALKLAGRWQAEISTTAISPTGGRKTLLKLKREPVDCSVKAESKNEHDDQSITSNLFFGQDDFKISSEKPATFAKHELWKGESLLAMLLQPINSISTKNGSVYLYNHSQKEFSGMIKIGFTRRAMTSRLTEWVECGHGNPVLIKCFNDVQHPERVEKLIHFELVGCWYELKWCKIHQQSHIEWFKVAPEIASSTAHLWSQWMERANPYDRRGNLKAFWKETIDFLTTYDIPITAALMIQIQEIEEGVTKLPGFIDDDTLWKRKPIVKQEPSD
jgi:hypothetical protein